MSATVIMAPASIDLRARLANKVQPTTDGLRAYLSAVE
jgi:hypothetical protein